MKCKKKKGSILRKQVSVANCHNHPQVIQKIQKYCVQVVLKIFINQNLYKCIV